MMNTHCCLMFLEEASEFIYYCLVLTVRQIWKQNELVFPFSGELGDPYVRNKMLKSDLWDKSIMF